MSGSPEHPPAAYGVRSPQPADTREATYAVRDVRDAEAVGAPAKAKERVAVFVAHGMGQQIPFQTLDQVTEGLRRRDPRWDSDDPQSEPRPNVETVEVDGVPIERVVLELQDAAGKAHEVHVYEGYWAPLTEGKVTLRDVIVFLFGAGRNGIANGSQPFRRWMFGEYPAFPAPIRTVIYLLTALAMVGSLVVLNTAVALVVAARSPLQSPPAWLSDGLFLDLTTTFNAFLVSLLPFALLVVAGILLHGRKAPRALRRAVGYASLPAFFVVVTATILAGISAPALFYGHVLWIAGKDQPIWPRVLGFAVEPFDRRFETWAFRLLILGVLLYLLARTYKVAAGVWREIFPAEGERQRGWWLTLVYGLCFGIVSFIAGYAIYRFVSWMLTLSTPGGHPWSLVRRGIAWPLLVVVGLFVRSMLVQYAGDVAAYVTPQTLDRFNKLRQEIKDCVGKTARAVYARREPDGGRYRQVIAVGHSLGSVVVYDTLNRLILEDELAGSRSPAFLDVVGRTPLFLTFGSPLNKIAFLFALQAQKTTEAREALAAAAQPLLLDDYRFRPERWINLYSPWDIISGSLSYFDPPGTRVETQPKAVCNQRDPDATTFLAAHVEYWENPLLFKTLYQQAVGEPAACVES